MPPLRRKRKNKAPCTVLFGSSKNEDGHKQICVFVECSFSGCQAGPVWGHSDQSIRRALATLSKECDCPAKFHKGAYFEGHRIQTPPSRR